MFLNIQTIHCIVIMNRIEQLLYINQGGTAGLSTRPWA